MTINFAEHDTTTDGASLAAAPKQDTYPYLLHGVDPRTLRTDGNSRVVGDIRQRRPELVASVAEHGVNPMVSMINVAPDDEGFTVLVGFHRTAAAVAVAERENPGLTIDVLVHAPGTTRQEVLVAQGIENLHREGYTQAEEAGLYEQLALAGLDDDTIAQTLTRPVERVTAGRAVAATSRTRAAASDQLPDTDLLVLGQLAEFADDEAAHNELVDVLARFPGNFDWKLGLLRRRRAQQEKRAEEVQRLIDLGHVVVDEDDIPETGARLDELCTGEGQALDPATHADCPGHAVSVYVDSSHEVKLTEFCTDFVAHGHHAITSVLVAAAEEQLRTDGVPVVEPGVEGQAKLRDLLADEHAQQPLTAEQHADCPGHAAYTRIMHGWSSADVHYVCTDYAAHGHVLHTVVVSRPEPDAAYQAAERKRAGVNNKAWREAKAARREWLITLFTGWRKRKTADLPARVHHWLALAPVLAADYLEEAAPSHHYACTLLKLGEPQDYQRDHNPIALHLRKKSATENQAVLIRLAQVIGACEEHWNRVYTEQADSSWRRPADAACFYFELLEALGYPLSHVEQLVNNPDLDNETWPHLSTNTGKVSELADADQPA